MSRAHAQVDAAWASYHLISTLAVVEGIVKQIPVYRPALHAKHWPRDVMYYADPSGANERSELSCAGFKVCPGNNALRPGIATVSARLENGTLKVVEGASPNLLAEAGLYRYSDDARDRQTETPVDEHNHALAALRYLISELDARYMARDRPTPGGPGSPPAPGQDPPRRGPRPWLRLDNEELWTPYNPG